MIQEITPSDLYSNTAIAGKMTKALYIAETAAGTAYTITCTANGEAVAFVTGGQFLPIKTAAAVTVAGNTVVYIY